MPTASAHGLALARSAALALALALAAGRVGADEARAAATVDEARFTDHCLEAPAAALPLYERAVREGAAGRALGEALYGKARALYLADRKAQAESVLEELAAMRRDDAMRPWPQRGEKALSTLLSGRDPYFRPARATGELTIRETRRPLQDVLLDLRKQAGASIALDGSFPEPWYVSADLGPLGFPALAERLIGPGRVRKVGEDAFVLGDVASDKALLARVFAYADLDAPADRALAGTLRTRRANLVMPAISVIEASRLLRDVAGAEVEVAPGALAIASRVRVWVEDAPVDIALDLVTHPLGLVWRIRGGRIVIDKRPRRGGDD